MRSRDENLEENLETIWKVSEDAAGKVAHSTKHEKNIGRRKPENVIIREEASRKVHKSDQKKSTQETSEESHGGTQVQFSTRNEKIQRKPLSELYVNGDS